MVLSERGFLTLKLRGADKHRVGYSRLIGYRVFKVTAVVIGFCSSNFLLTMNGWSKRSVLIFGIPFKDLTVFSTTLTDCSSGDSSCMIVEMDPSWTICAPVNSCLIIEHVLHIFVGTLGIAHVRRNASVSSWPSRPGSDRARAA